MEVSNLYERTSYQDMKPASLVNVPAGPAPEAGHPISSLLWPEGSLKVLPYNGTPMLILLLGAPF